MDINRRKTGLGRLIEIAGTKTLATHRSDVIGCHHRYCTIRANHSRV